jgi:hypothetical protein
MSGLTTDERERLKVLRAGNGSNRTAAHPAHSTSSFPSVRPRGPPGSTGALVERTCGRLKDAPQRHHPATASAKENSLGDRGVLMGTFIL